MSCAVLHSGKLTCDGWVCEPFDVCTVDTISWTSTRYRYRRSVSPYRLMSWCHIACTCVICTENNLVVRYYYNVYILRKDTGLKIWKHCTRTRARAFLRFSDASNRHPAYRNTKRSYHWCVAQWANWARNCMVQCGCVCVCVVQRAVNCDVEGMVVPIKGSVSIWPPLVSIGHAISIDNRD